MRLEQPQPLTGDDNMPAVGDPDDWEWHGEDGLTDSQRSALAQQFRVSVGANLTFGEIEALRSLAEADMLPGGGTGNA